MLLTIALAAAIQLAPADTLSGRWHLTGDVGGYPLDQICTFETSGSTLMGRCVAAAGGDAEGIVISGELKEGTVTFQHGGEYEGQPLTVIYTGKLETPTQLRGTVLVQPFDATGSFSAVPAPPAQP